MRPEILKQRFRDCVVIGLLMFSMTNSAAAGPSHAAGPLLDPGHQWKRVLLFQDYNTRVVVVGTCALGMACGLVGSFMLLRKRALMGDALAHATLPGIGLAFVIATNLGADGKSLPFLLLGAAITGMLGIGGILFVRNATPIKEDAAMGMVLSVFFGGGLAVLGVVQQMKSGHAAGLEAFIYGKTASMVAADAQRIAIVALFSVAMCVLLLKEFKLLCFDEVFAGSRGFPILFLDVLLMMLVVAVTIVGLQAVGLILMIALLVIPTAAARFWTQKLKPMMILSAVFGAVGCLVGASLSAVFPRLPSGAMIVLTTSSIFLFSMLLGTSHGVFVRLHRRRRLNRRIDRQHLLRGVYELLEDRKPTTGTPEDSGILKSLDHPLVLMAPLLQMRTWSPGRLKRCIARCQNEGLVVWESEAGVRLTALGDDEAERLTRQHRLWELYLIRYADIAPGRVDRDADAIEHVLEPEMIRELETALHLQTTRSKMPESPHVVPGHSISPSSDRNRIEQLPQE